MNYLQQTPGAGGLGLDKAGQFPYLVVLNGASGVSALLAGLASDRAGRRAVYSVLCLGGAAGSALLYAILHGAGGGVPGGLLATFAVVTASYGINGVIGVISSELFPTHLRSTGPGFAQNVGKGIGGMVGPPLAGALVVSAGYPLVLALPGLLLLVLSALIFTLPAVGGREVRAVEDRSFLGRGG